MAGPFNEVILDPLTYILQDVEHEHECNQADFTDITGLIQIKPSYLPIAFLVFATTGFGL